MASRDSEGARLADTISSGAVLLDLGLLKASHFAQFELWVAVEDLLSSKSFGCQDEARWLEGLTAPETSCAKLPPCLEA